VHDGLAGESWRLALVQDINKGSAPSLPAWITPIRGSTQALLVAGTTPLGRELWITDGTEAGTKLVTDLLPGADSAEPSQLLRHEQHDGTELVFFAAAGQADTAWHLATDSCAGARRSTLSG